MDSLCLQSKRYEFYSYLFTLNLYMLYSSPDLIPELVMAIFSISWPSFTPSMPGRTIPVLGGLFWLRLHRKA